MQNYVQFLPGTATRRLYITRLGGVFGGWRVLTIESILMSDYEQGSIYAQNQWQPMLQNFDVSSLVIDILCTRMYMRCTNAKIITR